MSKSRFAFIQEVEALAAAVSSPSVATSSGLKVDPGISVLRRGAAISALVMLEFFVRERTEEILEELQKWPAGYDDLPKRFRARATIDALANIEKFAKMLRREEDDFEQVIISQAGKISSMSPPSFQFTKFLAGDYTGNLSISNLEELLLGFQVKDCWRTMHNLSVDIGFGVPSVKEILKTIIGNRHRSAHTMGFNIAASDVSDLPQNVRLVGLCVDAALSTAMRSALEDWRNWVSDAFNWRSRLELFFLVPKGKNFRLVRRNAARAIRIVNKPGDARSLLRGRGNAVSRLIIEQSTDGRPYSWDIV